MDFRAETLIYLNDLAAFVVKPDFDRQRPIDGSMPPDADRCRRDDHAGV